MVTLANRVVRHGITLLPGTQVQLVGVKPATLLRPAMLTVRVGPLEVDVLRDSVA